MCVPTEGVRLIGGGALVGVGKNSVLSEGGLSDLFNFQESFYFEHLGDGGALLLCLFSC